jgi:hypothetical protein
MGACAAAGVGMAFHVVCSHLGDSPRRSGRNQFASFLKQPEMDGKLDVLPQSNVFTAFLKSTPSSSTPAVQDQGASWEQHEITKADKPLPGAKPVVVLFGSEYGYAKEVASQLCAALKTAGYWWGLPWVVVKAASLSRAIAMRGPLCPPNT